MRKTHDVEISILDQNENCFCYTLLFSSDKNDVKNLCIFNKTVEYILSTERFKVPLRITGIHNNP